MLENGHRATGAAAKFRHPVREGSSRPEPEASVFISIRKTHENPATFMDLLPKLAHSMRAIAVLAQKIRSLSDSASSPFGASSTSYSCLLRILGKVHENTISALILVNVQGESAHEDPTGTGFELVVAASYDRQLSFWRVTLTSDGSSQRLLSIF